MGSCPTQTSVSTTVGAGKEIVNSSVTVEFQPYTIRKDMNTAKKEAVMAQCDATLANANNALGCKKNK
jgi:hypothetical protein